MKTARWMFYVCSYLHIVCLMATSLEQAHYEDDVARSKVQLVRTEQGSHRMEIESKGFQYAHAKHEVDVALHQSNGNQEVLIKASALNHEESKPHQHHSEVEGEGEGESTSDDDSGTTLNCTAFESVGCSDVGDGTCDHFHFWETGEGDCSQVEDCQKQMCRRCWSDGTEIKLVDGNVPADKAGNMTISICTKVDCVFHPWGDWSSCSHTCGEFGVTTRSRNHSHGPLNGGTECTGDYMETKDCDHEACPTLAPINIEIKLPFWLIVYLYIRIYWFIFFPLFGLCCCGCCYCGYQAMYKEKPQGGEGYGEYEDEGFGAPF